MKVLLIEDDADTRQFVSSGLEAERIVVDATENGREGLFMASDSSYDVIIVDRMIPELDGLSLVKLLRGAGITVPVLFLTALDGIDERVIGLNAGGDDYLVKPFALSELLARIRALIRRPPLTAMETLLQVEDLSLDLLSREVRRGASRIELKPREYQLLEYLMLHAGEVVTRAMLLENVWDYNFDPKTSVVETHISRLRSKVDRPFAKKLIRTVRGGGYSIAGPG